MEFFSRSSRTFLICSNAGKPLWSNCGDDIAQARLSSVVQALTARSSDALGGGETLSSMSIGGGVFIVFISRGPLILLAASRSGETEAALRAQLKALHAQLLFSLTNKIHKRLIDRPGADVRPLLAGCDLPFKTLLRASSRSPALWLDAFPVLSLPSGMRSRSMSALSTSGTGNDDGIVFVVLSAGYSIVAFTQSSDAYQLQPQDFFLLSSFLCSSASKCREGADAWTPICLPGLSEGAFVSAYVACLGLGIPSGGQRATSIPSISSNSSLLMSDILSPKPPSNYGDSSSVSKNSGDSITASVPASEDVLYSSTAFRESTDINNDINTNNDSVPGISIVSPIPIPPPAGLLSGAVTQLAPSAAFSPLGRLSFASPLALALASAPLAPSYSTEHSNRRFEIDRERVETAVNIKSEENESLSLDLIEKTKKHIDLSGLDAQNQEEDNDNHESVLDDSNATHNYESSNTGINGEGEVEEFNTEKDGHEDDEEDVPSMNHILPTRILGGATPRVTRLARWAALSGASSDGTKVPLNVEMNNAVSQPPSRKIAPLPVPPSPWTPPPPYHPDRDGAATPLFLSIISTGSNSDHLESLASRRASIGRALLQKGLLDGILRSMECVNMEIQSGGGTAPFTTSDAPASSYGVAGLVHFLYLWKPSRQYTMSLWPNEMLSASSGITAFKVGHRKRKALLRAYQRLHERLTVASTPNVRHVTSSFIGGSFDERGRFTSDNSGAASIIAHVAGVNTNQSILLCSFDAAVDATKVPVLSEKLLKALRRDHDRLFFQ
jgi:hypothetical protein